MQETRTTTEVTEPDWLIAWRERKKLINPDKVTRAHEPFGVVRNTVDEFVSGVLPETVYAFVSGQPVQRRYKTRKMAKGGVRAITYSEAHREARSARSDDDEYTLGGSAWSILRADVSRFVRDGRSVLVDVEFPSRESMQRFTEFCFLSGARAAVAVCLTTEYEEDWLDDGWTGVVWMTE